MSNVFNQYNEDNHGNSIRKNEFQILKSISLALLIGLLSYKFATINMMMWVSISFVIPSVLLIVHCCGWNVFTPFFLKQKIAIIKYVTFLIQNLLLIIFYYHSNDKYLSLIVLFGYRLNVFEALLDLYKKKQYLLCLPTIFLLIGTSFDSVKDPTHLIALTHSDIFFVIEYSLWFIAWISTCYPDRFIAVTHALYPLFFNPIHWFSVRTLTGMVILTFNYIPWCFKNITDTSSKKDEIAAFGRIYKQVYLVVWVALYIYKFSAYAS